MIQGRIDESLIWEKNMVSKLTMEWLIRWPLWLIFSIRNTDDAGETYVGIMAGPIVIGISFVIGMITAIIAFRLQQIDGETCIVLLASSTSFYFLFGLIFYFIGTGFEDSHGAWQTRGPW